MPKKEAEFPFSYSDKIEQLLTKLRELKAEIPDLQLPIDNEDRLRETANASVPDRFLETVAVALTASPELRATAEADPAEIRDAIRYSAALQAIANEALAIYKAARFSIAVKRHKAGTDGLRTYGAAKILVKKPSGAGLRPHLGNMKESLGRGGRRKTEPKLEIE